MAKARDCKSLLLDLGAHVVISTSLVRIQPSLPIWESSKSATAAVCKTVPFEGSGVGTHLSHQYGAIDKWSKSSPFQGGVTGSNPVSITNMASSSKGQDTGLSTPKCWVRDPQMSPREICKWSKQASCKLVT